MFRTDSRFLIVDDSKATREIIRGSLSQLGFKYIDEAADGPMGLKKIKEAAKDQDPYSLVFCDINMPGYDGLKLLELVRTDEQIANTPFVIVTTENSKPTVIKAVMSGISGYMVKPFGLDDVRKKIEDLFKKASQKENPSQK